MSNNTVEHLLDDDTVEVPKTTSRKSKTTNKNLEMSKHADLLFPSDDEASATKPTLSARKQKCHDATRTYEPSKKKSKASTSEVMGAKKITAKELLGSDSEADDDDDLNDEVKTSVIYDTDETKNWLDNGFLNNEIILCEQCNVEIIKKKYMSHCRTNLHKSNCLINTEFSNTHIIATAFKNRIASYRVNPTPGVAFATIESFLEDIKNNVINLINYSLKRHHLLKINFELYAFFYLPKNDKQQLKSFNTSYLKVFKNSDLDELYSDIMSIFLKKFVEFQHCEPGWSFQSISHIEININKYTPMRGGTYLELPECIRNTKSCLNIKNNDNFCLLWSIVAALYPCDKNVCRSSSYPHFSKVLNTQGVTFPPSSCDISLLEKNNNSISINIYGLDEKNNVTGPLYLTKQRKIDHINILYIEKKTKGHYCLIKNLETLIKRQVSSHHGKIYLCENCLQIFSVITKINTHKCSNVVSVLPKRNSILEFKNYERKQKVPFVIYADFESILVNYNDDTDGNTKRYKEHQPSCFGYYICCSQEPSLNKYVAYRGLDCVEVFVKRIKAEAIRICSILKINKPMLQLTKKQENEYKNATRCHICSRFLFDDKVMDHNHFTAEYRGAAHAYCNLMYKTCSFIPVIFHNLSNYDCRTSIKIYDVIDAGNIIISIE